MKERNKLLLNKKAISPVVATVILVAVTIVVAVAVSYWMGSIAGLYTRFEKLEISNAWSEKDTEGNWTITIMLRNTGTADASVTDIYIKGKPLNLMDGTMLNVTTLAPDPEGLPVSVKSGSEETIKFKLLYSGQYAEGNNIEVKLHTAAGQDYPRMITLT